MSVHCSKKNKVWSWFLSKRFLIYSYCLKVHYRLLFMFSTLFSSFIIIVRICDISIYLFLVRLAARSSPAIRPWSSGESSYFSSSFFIFDHFDRELYLNKHTPQFSSWSWFLRRTSWCFINILLLGLLLLNYYNIL